MARRRPGPGAALFEAVREDPGELPLVVEDLGFLDGGVVGYYRDLDDRRRDCFDYALGTDGTDVAWDVTDAVWNSAAVLAVTTLPGLLGLGSEARLNTPGTATGDWRWRAEREDFEDGVADRLAALTATARR